MNSLGTVHRRRSRPGGHTTGFASGTTLNRCRTSSSGNDTRARWSSWLRSTVHCAPRSRPSPNRSGTPLPVERGHLGPDVPVVEDTRLMDRHGDEELQPVPPTVVGRPEEAGTGDLPRSGRLVAGDHVVHVVIHVVGRKMDIVTRQGDVVPTVELDVGMSQCPFGKVT